MTAVHADEPVEETSDKRKATLWILFFAAILLDFL
jgi:hypothetical protein